MNGLSDIRLTLHTQELEETQQPSIRKTTRPPGTRWAQFWLRLQTREALLDLDARALRDVGPTREQALDEALKPFWRL